MVEGDLEIVAGDVWLFVIATVDDLVYRQHELGMYISPVWCIYKDARGFQLNACCQDFLY